MRTFKLRRLEDVSGISGVGLVAEGTQFHDGQCTLSWFSQYHSVEVSPDVETVVALHGHNGKTVLEWDDAKESMPNNTTKTTDERLAALEELAIEQAEEINILREKVTELEVSSLGGGFSVDYVEDEPF